MSTNKIFLRVGEDPWMRSEIGMAGHYLDRPPAFAFHKNNVNHNNKAYKAKRSTSVEPISERSHVELIIRPCKSLEQCSDLKNANAILFESE